MCYVAFKENLKVLSCPSTPFGMTSSNKDLYQNHGFTTSQPLRVLRGLKGTKKFLHYCCILDCACLITYSNKDLKIFGFIKLELCKRKPLTKYCVFFGAVREKKILGVVVAPTYLF